MALANTSMAKICLEISNHINNLGKEPNDVDSDWAQIDVITGAPGANLVDANVDTNTLNVFFYRFKPAGFNASAGIGDIHWMKVFCIITAFGFDENDDKNLAGINELRMLSEVMRLFQEEPVKLIKGIDDKDWHTQFIPRPLADEQINQIWSTQGSVIYRPSVVYEIALAPIEPLKPSAQSARVASIGVASSANINNRHSSWSDAQRDTRFPLVPTMSVDISNPQWAPAIAMVTGDNNNRQAGLTLNILVAKNGVISIPAIDIWLAGDTDVSVKIDFTGQLFQNGSWTDIALVTNQNADNETLDMENLPVIDATKFKLEQLHWTGLDEAHQNWQLQFFAERKITINNVEVRIRSNPILINVNRDEN